MTSDATPSAYDPFLGEAVVLDLRSSYVCLGTLVAAGVEFVELRDADLHDFRDSVRHPRGLRLRLGQRLGIRRNRARVLIRRDEVVALARFDDIAGVADRRRNAFRKRHGLCVTLLDEASRDIRPSGDEISVMIISSGRRMSRCRPRRAVNRSNDHDNR